MDGYKLLGWNGSTYVDLVVDTDFNISITLEISNVLEPTLNSGVWSKEFSLPDDPINNNFFDGIWKTGYSSTGFNPKRGIKGKLLTIGGSLIKDVFIIIKDIDYLHGDKRWNCELYSTQRSFFNDIEGRRLNELDFSEFDHIRNRENIILSHTYSVSINGNINYLDGPGVGYVYPAIIYGGSNNISLNYNIYDLYPAIYSKTILKKIVEFSGRKFKESKLTESNEFLMDILPFVNEKLEIKAEDQVDRKSIIGITDDYAILTPIRTRGSGWVYGNELPGFTRESGEVTDMGNDLTFMDNLNQFNNDVVGAFYCKNQGYYDINFIGHGVLDMIRYDGSGNPDPGEPINYTEGSGGFEAQISLHVIRLDGTQQQLSYQLIDDWVPSTGEYPSPWIDDNSTQLFGVNADNILLAVGEVVYVKYGFRYPGDVNWGPPADADRVRVRLRFKKLVSGEFSKFEVEPSNNVDMGNNMVDMNSIVPDMEIDEYLSNIKNMYNIIINDDGEFISFEQWDEYFNFDSDYEWDDLWNEEAGYNKIPMSEVDFNQYKLSYDKDEDIFNKEYFESTKEIYGNKILNIVNDRSSKKYEKKVSFASTPISNRWTYGVVQPHFVEKDGDGVKSKKVKPRILKYGGLIDTSYIIIQDYPAPLSGDFTVLNKYPYCGMWDHPYDPTISLEFNKSKFVYYDAVNIPKLNLFDKYHKNSINSIINNDACLIETEFYLSDKEMCEFDFRKKINWLGNKWRVNKIMDYNPGKSSKLTKVQLYKILDVIDSNSRNVTISSVSNACPIDVVARRGKTGYVYVSLSGQEISENCCSLMNGNYKNGVCYAGRDISFSDGLTGPKVPFVSTPDPTGPITWVKDGNSINSTGIYVRGLNNYVPSGMTNSSAMILGNNNTITPWFVGLNIGDGIFATTSGLNVGTYSHMDLNGNFTTKNIITETINGVTASILTSGLPGVLSIDNTTGGNDIVVNTGDKITSEIGGQLDLFSDTNITHSVDNGGVNNSNIYQEDFEIQAIVSNVAGNSSNITIGPDSTSIYASDVASNITDTISIDPQQLGYGTGIVSKNSSTFEKGSLFISPSDTSLGVSVGTNSSGLATDINQSFIRTSVANILIDTISVDPTGISNGTGITSLFTPLSLTSSILLTPQTVLASVSGGISSVSDIFSIDPQGLFYGTTLFSEDVTNDLIAGLQVNTTSGTRIFSNDNNIGSDASSTFKPDKIETNVQGVSDTSSTIMTENTLVSYSTDIANGITDNISIDPQFIGNGTGIHSENGTTSETSRVQVAPNRTSLYSEDASGPIAFSRVQVEPTIITIESTNINIPTLGTASPVNNVGIDAGGNLVIGTSGGSTLETVGTVTGTSSIIDDITLVNNSTDVTITLPTAVGVSGKKYRIKSINNTTGVNNITIDSVSGDIDTLATYVMSIPFESITVVSDGLDWWIV